MGVISVRTSIPGPFAVEVLLVIVVIKAWRLNFRTIEPVLHLSRWVEAVVEPSNPGLFALEGSTATSDSRYQVGAIDFQDV